MKLELTEEEKSQLTEVWEEHNDIDVPAWRLEPVIEKCLELASAKIPPPARWVRSDTQKPEASDFMSASANSSDNGKLIIYCPSVSGVFINDPLYIFGISGISGERYWLENLPPFPKPEDAETRKFNEFLAQNPGTVMTRAMWDFVRSA